MEYSSEANQQQAQYNKKFNPRQIPNSDDRCHKSGDSKYIDEFQYSACNYQCRNCHKFGHLVACVTRSRNLSRIQAQDHPKHTNVSAPQHLFTNLEVKVKLHKNKTNFMCARLDTYADVNIMPCSVYQLLFKDPDCTKLALSDLQLGT